MRLLITGLNGTLAPRLAQAARLAGCEVIGWDRAAVDPDDEARSADVGTGRASPRPPLRAARRPVAVLGGTAQDGRDRLRTTSRGGP